MPISAISRADTPRFSRGSSRNQAYHQMAHRMPTPPKTKNVALQLKAACSGTTSTGEIAAPNRLAIQTTPWAPARSRGGNQRVIVAAAFGKAPASPAPKQNRVTKSGQKPVARPVSAVNADHQVTIRASTRRGPIRSPSAPLGTSKTAYESDGDAHADAVR